MPSQYNLRIKATLDDSDVKNKLKGLGSGGGGAPAPGGGSAKPSQNVERAALAVNAAALARSLNILGREFDEISKNLGSGGGLAKGISEFSRTMSNVTMLGRSLGGFGVALGLATEAVRLWSKTVAEVRDNVRQGQDAAADITKNREMRKREEEYRGMSETERNTKRYELTQQKKQYEDKAVDIAQKLAVYGGDYEEYKKTALGMVQGAWQGMGMDEWFDSIAQKLGPGAPDNFKEITAKFKDMLESTNNDISAIDETLGIYDRVDREKNTDGLKQWEEVAPEIRYAAQRGNDLGGGLASIGGNIAGISTQESQLKELQEIHTLVGYMRNVMMERGLIATYDD